jgi:hypothetical protein
MLFSHLGNDTLFVVERKVPRPPSSFTHCRCQTHPNGSAFEAHYVGAGPGPATLSGKRAGNSLELIINWAKEINGDRQAQLSVAKAGARGLTLTTTDKDPLSGKSVVTSMIVLQRI